MKLGGNVFFENTDMFSFFKENMREPWVFETIESDVQTYGEEIKGKIFTGFNLRNSLKDLSEKLIEPISQLEKGHYKEGEKIYFDFIKFIVQHKRVTKELPQEETFTQDDSDTEVEDIEDNSDNLYQSPDYHLSSLEKAALLYLKYKSLIGLDTQSPDFEKIDTEIKSLILQQKDALEALKHFTPQGIMQLANRAGLKMIFRERR